MKSEIIELLLILIIFLSGFFFGYFLKNKNAINIQNYYSVSPEVISYIDELDELKKTKNKKKYPSH